MAKQVIKTDAIEDGGSYWVGVVEDAKRGPMGTLWIVSFDAAGEPTWSELRGCVESVDAETARKAVTLAVEAGLTYIIEQEC